MGPRSPMSVKFQNKSSQLLSRQHTKQSRIVHDDRVNGLVSYKGHAHTHTHRHTLIFIYIDRRYKKKDI